MQEEDEYSDDEENVRIPNNMKPFLNKEINFDLFVEMLTNKLDV